MNAPKRRTGAILDAMLHANAAAVVTDVIVTTYRLFSAVHRKRSTSTRSVDDSPSSEWRSSSSPAVESASRLDCFQNSRITKTSSAPTPSTMNTPKKLSIPIHVTPIACTYTNCATTSDAMTAVIPPRARNVEPVCALTRKSVVQNEPAAHLKSPQRYSRPMSLSAHMCRHDAVISPSPHDSTIGPATSFAHRVAAAYPGVPFGASRNASRVTSVLALASSSPSPSAPASPKRRSARRLHGAASAAISNVPPLRSLHRAATAPNLIALAADAGSKDPFSHPSSSDDVDCRKSAQATVFTSSSVGAADRIQSHTSTRPFPTTHARAVTSSLASHPRGSHPRLGRNPHRTPPAESRVAHTRRTDSIPSFNSKTARAVRANASGTPRRPTCSYAETTSNTENAGAHPSRSFLLEAANPVWFWLLVAVFSLTRAHAPPYPGDRSIALLSSHTRRSARDPNASPSAAAREVLTMTVNSSAPPAPPQAPALGSVASALSGALLLGKSARTLDAVSLAAAPGNSASSRSTRRASASIDVPNSTSSGDAGPRGGSVVTVDVETSLSNCRERSPVLVPRTR